MLNAYRMLRLDRFFTLGLFRPLLRLKLIKKNPGIPILMYHSISEDLLPGVHPYYQTSTSPKTFRKHMSFLTENGYSVLPLKEAVALLTTGHSYDSNALVLTFDDGLKDFYTEAFPILQAYGHPSTVFLPTAFVDNQSSKFKGKSCLSWDEVRELSGHGVAFGSHTVTHPELAALSPDDLRAELEVSKKIIELQLGEHVESFSYPFAFPDEDTTFTLTLKRVLETAGYRYGVTTKIGTCTAQEDILFLKRIPVNEYDGIELLRAKLDGAYEWVYPVQRLSKYIKVIMKKAVKNPSPFIPQIGNSVLLATSKSRKHPTTQ